MRLPLCMAALLVIPAAATAQVNPGPFGGLFGRTPDRLGREYTVVEVRSSVGGLYDTSVLPKEDAAVRGVIQGAAGGRTTATLLIERASQRLTTGLAGSGAYEQYFVKPSAHRSISFQGGGRVAAKVTTRLGVEAALNYAHSPYFQLLSGIPSSGLANDIIPPLSLGTAAAFVENETYNGSAALMAQLGKRATFDAMAYRQETRFRNEQDNNLFVNGARATLGRTLSRGLRVHASYGREHSAQRADASRRFVNEIVDVGMDFSRQLSLARKTSLGFSTSTGMVRDHLHRRFRVNGAVTLSKQFRRTWHAGAFASRGTEVRPGFTEPIFSDAVGGSIGGMLSRRAEWTAMASAGQGELAFSETQGFTSILATSRLTVGITRHVGVYGQYASYFYDTAARSTTLPLRGRMERRMVSVGLTAYIPIYDKMRTPR